MTRAQADLVATATALLVLTTVTGLGLAIADGALASAERDAPERRIAHALAERMVAERSPLTDRPNVLNASAIRKLNGSYLRRTFPVANGTAVRVTVGGRTVAETGSVDSGTSVRRVVLVGRRQRARVQPDDPGTETIHLPRRTDRIRLLVAPPPSTSVGTVRANGRVVLYNASGLDGVYTVDVSRFETAGINVSADRPLPNGSVAVTYYPLETRKNTIEVTVDD